MYHVKIRSKRKMTMSLQSTSALALRWRSSARPKNRSARASISLRKLAARGSLTQGLICGGYMVSRHQ